MVRSISGILSDIVSDCCINSFSPELPLLDDTAKFILTSGNFIPPGAVIPGASGNFDLFVINSYQMGI